MAAKSILVPPAAGYKATLAVPGLSKPLEPVGLGAAPSGADVGTLQAAANKMVAAGTRSLVYRAYTGVRSGTKVLWVRKARQIGLSTAGLPLGMYVTSARSAPVKQARSSDYYLDNGAVPYTSTTTHIYVGGPNAGTQVYPASGSASTARELSGQVLSGPAFRAPPYLTAMRLFAGLGKGRKRSTPPYYNNEYQNPDTDAWSPQQQYHMYATALGCAENRPAWWFDTALGKTLYLRAAQAHLRMAKRCAEVGDARGFAAFLAVFPALTYTPVNAGQPYLWPSNLFDFYDYSSTEWAYMGNGFTSYDELAMWLTFTPSTPQYQTVSNQVAQVQYQTEPFESRTWVHDAQTGYNENMSAYRSGSAHTTSHKLTVTAPLVSGARSVLLVYNLKALYDHLSAQLDAIAAAPTAVIQPAAVTRVDELGWGSAEYTCTIEVQETHSMNNIGGAYTSLDRVVTTVTAQNTWTGKIITPHRPPLTASFTCTAGKTTDDKTDGSGDGSGGTTTQVYVKTFTETVTSTVDDATAADLTPEGVLAVSFSDTFNVNAQPSGQTNAPKDAVTWTGVTRTRVGAAQTPPVAAAVTKAFAQLGDKLVSVRLVPWGNSYGQDWTYLNSTVLSGITRLSWAENYQHTWIQSLGNAAPPATPWAVTASVSIDALAMNSVDQFRFPWLLRDTPYASAGATGSSDWGNSNPGSLLFPFGAYVDNTGDVLNAVGAKYNTADLEGSFSGTRTPYVTWQNMPTAGAACSASMRGLGALEQLVTNETASVAYRADTNSNDWTVTAVPHRMVGVGTDQVCNVFVHPSAPGKDAQGRATMAGVLQDFQAAVNAGAGEKIGNW